MRNFFINVILSEVGKSCSQSMELESQKRVNSSFNIIAIFYIVEISFLDYIIRTLVHLYSDMAICRSRDNPRDWQISRETMHLIICCSYISQISSSNVAQTIYCAEEGLDVRYTTTLPGNSCLVSTVKRRYHLSDKYTLTSVVF